MKIAQICLAVCMLSSTGISEAVRETSVVVVGVNIRGYGGVSEQKQTAKVEELQANRVKTIREAFPSTLNTSFNQFIIKAYQHGIGTVAIIYPSLGLQSRAVQKSLRGPTGGAGGCGRQTYRD
jgi:hypothetical protein